MPGTSRSGRSVLSALILAGLAAAPAQAQKVVASGVDSVRVRGNVQAQFNTTSADGEPDSEWLLRRARLAIGASSGGWLHAFVEGDFGRGDARLTDGYVTLQFDPRLAIRAGQFKVPFDELERILREGNGADEQRQVHGEEGMDGLLAWLAERTSSAS